MSELTEAEVWRRMKAGIRRGDRCAFCGGRHDRYDQERGWEGWEITDGFNDHVRYVPDDPKQLCDC